MGSWKFETELSREELPGLLRALAQALEGGGAQDALAGLPPGLRKLVLVAEARGQGYALKLKAKRAEEVLVREKPKPAPAAAPVRKAAPGASGPGRDKYRQVKKALQADFKALRRAAEAGRLPEADVRESFIGLCQAMCDMEQPAAGPEGAELMRASRACLEEALALRGLSGPTALAALADLLDRLERRKSACHAQFK